MRKAASDGCQYIDLGLDTRRRHGLRHSSVGTTPDIYAHRLKEARRAANIRARESRSEFVRLRDVDEDPTSSFCQLWWQSRCQEW